MANVPNGWHEYCKQCEDPTIRGLLEAYRCGHEHGMEEERRRNELVKE